MAGGVHGWGVCCRDGVYGKGCVWLEGGDMCLGKTATEVGGTHPTGMYVFN